MIRVELPPTSNGSGSGSSGGSDASDRVCAFTEVESNERHTRSFVTALAASDAVILVIPAVGSAFADPLLTRFLLLLTAFDGPARPLIVCITRMDDQSIDWSGM